MRLLMLFAESFHLETDHKILADVPDDERTERAEKATVALIHVEPGDGDDEARAVRKLIKNIKWQAGKFGSKRAVLAYFSHLGTRVAEPAVAQAIVDRAAERLRGADYDVVQMPFGYLCSWGIEVGGEGLARVYKEW